MTDKIAAAGPTVPRQPITDQERDGWRVAAVADSPPLAPEWLARLDEKPYRITTTAPREFFEVCRREREGRLRVASLERGIMVPHGKRSRRDPAGWTFFVYYPAAIQKPLL